MAIIALSLALIFAVWLVVLDCRRRPTVSVAIWIPILLVMVLGSRPVSQWLHGGNAYFQEMGNEVATNPVDLIFYACVIAGSLVITVRRGIKWNRILAANLAILFFYFYFLLSVCWSGDPSGSFKRIVKDFGMIFVIGVIFSEKDPLQAMRAVYIRSAAFLVPLSLVFVRWYPSYGRVYTRGGGMSVTGVTGQKNTLGEVTMLFTLFLVWDYLETRAAGTKRGLRQIRWDQLILTVMCLWLLRASQSKTALVCLVVGIILAVGYRSLFSGAVNLGVFSAAMSLPFLLFFSQQFSSVIAPLVAAMGRDMTFTGRANIWEHITLDTVNPIVGCGYWNFWGGPGGFAISQAMTTTIPTAHNGYLDIYLDGGFIGLGVLFVFLIARGRHLLGRLRKLGSGNYYARISFAVLIMAIIYNLSESTWARMGLIWFTTLLMIADFPVKQQVKRAQIAAGREASRSLKNEQHAFVNR